MNLYNLSGERGVENASVKGQCSHSFFYGERPEFEGALQYFEDRCGEIVSRIERGTGAISSSDLAFLRSFAFLQFSRTEEAAKRRRIAYEGMEDLTYRGVEHLRPDRDLGNANMTRSSLATFGKSHDALDDLEVCLVRNDHPRDFVTSDNPAVLTNRLYMQRLSDNSLGFIQSGTILLMPLTPRVALLTYDKAVYTPTSRSGPWIRLKGERDVRAINEFQYLNCSANIYFQDWRELPLIQNEIRSVSDGRLESAFGFWVGVQTSEDARTEWYRRATEAEINNPRITKVIAHYPIYPYPVSWPSILAFRSKPIGYTNGSAPGHVRKMHADRAGMDSRHRVVLPSRPERGRSRTNPQEAMIVKRRS